MKTQKERNAKRELSDGGEYNFLEVGEIEYGVAG